MLGMNADIGAVMPAAHALGRFGRGHDQLRVCGTKTGGERFGRRRTEIMHAHVGGDEEEAQLVAACGHACSRRGVEIQIDFGLERTAEFLLVAQFLDAFQRGAAQGCSLGGEGSAHRLYHGD